MADTNDNQLSLFETAVVDPPLRDNRDAMELPFLALQKRRRVDIEYRSERAYVVVMPPPSRFGGIATVWDWDIIIGLQSIINEHREQGLPYGPRVRFAPAHLLEIIKRSSGGKDYKELAQGIRRLRFTAIQTNVRMEDQPDLGAEEGFNWLAGYKIPKKYTKGTTALDDADPSGSADASHPWEVELSPWLYAALIRTTGILAVHPDYFQITGGIERWLYRLARKAVPKDQGAWAFHLATLHKMSGVSGRLRDFAKELHRIADEKTLPEYSIEITSTGTGRRKVEMVHIYRDRKKPGRPWRGLPPVED